ncbi:MAG: ATP-binding protein [Lachnospiraceae bacterium]|nr:ATP-binding protein [Lachnospiraceae bacterium]
MKVAVLSGKGGAGKTCISVNLAALADQGIYIDCDVEEPNGRLFLKPEIKEQLEVYKSLPEFDAGKCNGCRECVDFCRFNALIYIKEKPKVFDEVCHSCGGCMLVCPSKAITERNRAIGMVEIGTAGTTKVVTGILNTGEASGVPVIKKALELGDESNRFIVIDCPPGSACSVTESITDADYCIIVAEPTAFGFHNFQMVHRLTKLLHKPSGVVINKVEELYQPLEKYCKEENLEILSRIPYSKEAAKRISEGKLLIHTDDVFQEAMMQVLRKIGGDRQ